jgi:pyruvate,water dikinase
MAHTSARVVWFKDVDKHDIGLVGGKGANLGEMTHAKFPVPNGFVVTANAYYQFIKENNLAKKIQHLLKTANYNKSDSLDQVSHHIKKLIIHSDFSEELASEIFTFYRTLGASLHDPLVAVRSSATAEDLPGASFAGQQETFLNVHGEANLIVAIREAWASLFNARAIFYRHQQKFDHFRIGIAIVVQKMVESDQSGIMFTIDPVTNDKNKVVIEAIYGLGELIVQGEVTPDHYEVTKKDNDITVKQLSLQTHQLKRVSKKNKDVAIPKKEGEKQKIPNNIILELAELGKKLERHYYFPQDVEWAVEKGKVFIVQTRPITTIKTAAQQKKSDAKSEVSSQKLTVLLSGDPASPGIASGPVRVLTSAKQINQILPGEVLVAPQTNPDFVPAMKKAVAIITDRGGRTSHAAIVSRELGIPAIVGTENATKVLKTGQVVTVNGAKGEIYKGGMMSSSLGVPRLISSMAHTKTATKVYVNLGEPELASTIAAKNVDGVGLLRAEFMMAQIGIHPKKLIREHKKQTYINKLAEGLEEFCKAFGDRPVVYRTSDFKTNEYRNLVGGRDFEPEEPNPMLGYRGVFRYINDPDVFHLELEAIKKVREKHKNLWMMLPFVRTVKELVLVKKLISQAGLYRSETFKLWMMVEIPSNVILLEKFIYAGIDGVSIGSNDLTMLMLGTDRDNSEVAREFDEQNDAVLWALERVVKTAKEHKITSSLCGQAASSYPSLVEKLVSWGITSVSISPDAAESVRQTIVECEKKMVK